MELVYKKDDLFTSQEHLVHCVSADLSMSAGIAVVIKEQFGKPILPSGYVLQIGTVIRTYDHNDKNRSIFHLVTKERYWEKPNLTDMKATLINLKKTLEAKGIREISMPRIGCGLDRLAWYDVEQLIKEIFAEMEITITVYYL